MQIFNSSHRAVGEMTSLAAAVVAVVAVVKVAIRIHLFSMRPRLRPLALVKPQSNVSLMTAQRIRWCAVNAGLRIGGGFLYSSADLVAWSWTVIVLLPCIGHWLVSLMDVVSTAAWHGARCGSWELFWEYLQFGV